MKDLTHFHSHIIVEVTFYKEPPPGVKGCMPSDSYILLTFTGFNTTFTGKCFFIDKTKNCPGETAKAKIVITAFHVVESSLYIGKPFLIHGNGTRPVGEGVILNIVKV